MCMLCVGFDLEFDWYVGRLCLAVSVSFLFFVFYVSVICFFLVCECDLCDLCSLRKPLFLVE